MLHSVALISAVEQGDSAMALSLVAEVVSNSCDPMNHRPSSSSVHGTVQARALEWVAMPSSRGSSRPRPPALQADASPSSHRGSIPSAAASLLSRVRLCDPVACSPPGSSVRGILQARRLEWGATAFSSAMYTYIPSWGFLPPHPAPPLVITGQGAELPGYSALPISWLFSMQLVYRRRCYSPNLSLLLCPSLCSQVRSILTCRGSYNHHQEYFNYIYIYIYICTFEGCYIMNKTNLPFDLSLYFTFSVALP